MFVLAREQATGERIVRDDRYLFLRTKRQQIALEVSEQKIVAGLNGLNPHKVPDTLLPRARATL